MNADAKEKDDIRYITEEMAVKLVRNALAVAGLEMGEGGDHWPAVKATINDIEKDYERLQIERDVHLQLKAELGKVLCDMDREMANCPADIRPQMQHKLKTLHDIYDAYFTAFDENNLYLSNEETPAHIKRAETIIDTLESNDD